VKKLAFLLLLVTSATAAAESGPIYVKQSSWVATMTAVRKHLAQTSAKLDRNAVYADLYRRFWDDFPETDWFMQDNPRRPEAVNDFNPHRDFGW